MESSKNGRWFIPFKKFSRLRVKEINKLNLLDHLITNCYITGPSVFFPHDDDVDYPTDMKGELTQTMPYHNMVDDNGDIKLCVVCGERASGFYFGALVCLPCKVTSLLSYIFNYYTFIKCAGTSSTNYVHLY